jgi:hypothetical protein
MSTVLHQRQQPSPPATQTSLPHVVITGDLRLVVIESDAARGPITGSYCIETREMQEPLLVLWSAEGQVLSRQARATDITFEMRGTRAGQTLIYPVQVQVTDRWTSVVSGVFVQILVTADTPLQEAA